MVPNVDGWLERASSFGGRVGSLAAGRSGGEALAFAISMAAAFYGSGSQQVEMIRRRAETIPREKGSAYPEILVYEFAVGCIQNMAAEIKGGLVQNIRLGIVGEVLADLVSMAREALNERSVSVAAVLTAAAFEDLMRRLGQEKAGIRGRIKLDQVLIELKEKGVLQGGEPGVAQSFLKFRNDSLHADWNNVTESQVSSCLGLLDSLIIKHLS
jgi:uncharacterized membrane protein YeaQ/YmgE (transglycosylase-associated protein family)